MRNNLLTPEQDIIARQHAGTMHRRALADLIGVPEWKIKDWGKRTRTSVGVRRKYPLALIHEVSQFYEQHGEAETRKRFPGLNVRSITTTYPHLRKPRYYKWTWREILDLVKMGGLVSNEAQGRFFKGRHGSRAIKATWRRHIGRHVNSHLHGLSRSKARQLVTDDAKFIKVYNNHYICLWVEIEKHLRPDAPAFIRECVESMSQLQMWLWQSDQPDKRIKALIRRRER